VVRACESCENRSPPRIFLRISHHSRDSTSIDTDSTRFLYCGRLAAAVVGHAEPMGDPTGRAFTEEEAARVASIDVRLVDVTKSFGADAVAVDHVSLDVMDGEFFSLLGPSGCGKTTTLRMIGGFEEPTSGLIELHGEDVTWLPPYKRNVNTVFQNYALFPHLTIYENVAFGLRRKKVGKDEVKRRVAEMLELVELKGFDKRKPGQISGGQAQRVALARALVNRPSVLLLDEPLGALDLKLRKQMQIELKGIQQEVGITFVYVTHDQEEAMTMSDRIAVMNKGKYEQLGSPEELYERPATRFVASFLGASNLLPGTVTDRSGAHGVVKLKDGATMRVASSLLQGKTNVDVGVRPEKIRLQDVSGGGTNGVNRLTGRIRSSAYTGVATQYQVELPNGATVAVYEQNLERALGRSLRHPGDDVDLTWSPDDTFAVESAGSAGSTIVDGTGDTDGQTADDVARHIHDHEHGHAHDHGQGHDHEHDPGGDVHDA
jgi:spermidine/putrescine transport system ATP-binding protein